jgi:hypothetical protein
MPQASIAVRDTAISAPVARPVGSVRAYSGPSCLP